ncbi:MAG: hypothetical protein LKF42_03805 [Streptococcaceae bacterium]|jgi:hypothetical protein|nr:hypothetical protein [Streptococcaceae bacterium]MCH4176949.1 hypothetical protein [Streptococcaceae bacterium]
MNHKVLLIQPYFGKLPNYFELWLWSMANNPEFQVLLVTDCDLSTYHLPANIFVQQMTFAQLRQLISEKLAMPIYLEKPYKLVDYRISFAKIFEENLEDYSHWGWFDIDLTFGRLSHFISEDMLEKYDKIGAFGHLTILKNNKQINCLYLQENLWPVSYKEMYLSPQRFNTNEAGGINRVFYQLGWQYGKFPFSDIGYSQPKWRDSRYSTPYQFFFVADKRVFIATSQAKDAEILVEEVAYIHYQKRSLKNLENVNFNQPFYFSNQGVYNFELKNLPQLLWQDKLNPWMTRYYLYQNFIKKAWLYAFGKGTMDRHIKEQQQEMMQLIQNEREKNIIGTWEGISQQILSNKF